MTPRMIALRRVKCEGFRSRLTLKIPNFAQQD
jgi:hypothetical protein